MLENIDSKNLLNKIKSKQPLILLIHSSWCGECEMLKTSLKAVSEKEKYKEYLFFSLDSKEISSIYESIEEINSFPTLIEFNNSIEIKRISNYVNSKEIMEFIDSEQ